MTAMKGSNIDNQEVSEDKCFKSRGVTYNMLETVCLQPPKKDAPPFIGRIETIGAEQPGGGRQIRVAWYYRPEEAAGGRKAFHSVNELFASDHFDWVDAASILSKCRVHTLAAYQSISTLKSTDYFARFSYKAKTGQFKPDRIPSYCVCEMPYNPDLGMVECPWCMEWYHPECIGLDRNSVGAGAEFKCHECLNNGSGAAGDTAGGDGKAVVHHANKKARAI